MARALKHPVVLAVGGSDSSGGAGIQADAKTLEAFGVRAATAVTAVTVQTGRRVLSVRALPAALVAEQIRAVVASQRVTVVKCGMLARPSSVRAVASLVREFDLPVVVDPVCRSGGGDSLGGDAVTAALRAELIPAARVVTANLGEAEAICERPVRCERDMADAARDIVGMGAQAAIVTGGHLPGRPVDVLYDGTRLARFEQPVRHRRDMHGTGCAFASALAAGLAKGRPLVRSASDAAEHVAGLIASAERTRDGAWLRSAASRVATRHRPRS